MSLRNEPGQYTTIDIISFKQTAEGLFRPERGDVRKSASVRSTAILTTSYVAGTELDVRDYSQLEIYADATLGSLTSIEVKIEFSSTSGGTLFQETTESISGATIVQNLAEHQISVDGNYRISVPINDMYCTISAKGTGTVTGSSLTITATLGG